MKKILFLVGAALIVSSTLVTAKEFDKNRSPAPVLNISQYGQIKNFQDTIEKKMGCLHQMLIKKTNMSFWLCGSGDTTFFYQYGNISLSRENTWMFVVDTNYSVDDYTAPKFYINLNSSLPGLDRFFPKTKRMEFTWTNINGNKRIAEKIFVENNGHVEFLGYTDTAFDDLIKNFKDLNKLLDITLVLLAKN